MRYHIVLGHELAEKLGKHHYDVIQGKGGFWIKDKGFFTLAQAHKITGIKASPRTKRQVLTPYGDYATIAMINRVK